MTIEFFEAAANNRVDEVRGLLDTAGNVDVNFQAPGGITALHAAIKSRHVKVVKVLLDYGACKDIEDGDGHTALSLSKEFFEQEIFDLLHPELASARLEEEQRVQTQIDAYRLNHQFIIAKKTLVGLGTHYLQHEQLKADSGLNKDNVIQYITSAIEHMTLDLLEAKKIKIVDTASDKLWNDDMLCAISACAFYIRENRSDIVGDLTNIAWESLALYIRHSQYNPNFISSLEHKTIIELVYNALRAMLDSGELEEMRNYVENHQTTSGLPRLNALMGFLSDEYNAQYIEDGIKNYRDHGNLSSLEGRARLLMSFIEIGEALENASPRLQSLFDEGIIEHLLRIRNAIVHPERTGNREVVINFLNDKSNNDITINLQDLAKYCSDKHSDVSNFLQQYKTPKADDLWQDIEANVNRYILPKVKIPRASNEELKRILQDYSEKIAQLEQQHIDCLETLNQHMIEWFNEKGFSDKIKEKLKNPQKALEEVKNFLEKYKHEYSKEQNKELTEVYDNMKIKKAEWERYSQKQSNIAREFNAKKQQAEQGKIRDISKFAIELIDDYLSYSTQVETLFDKLNDFQHTVRTSANETSRGFSGHQDHPVLAFYQIMTGASYKTLIEINNKNKIIPPELLNTFKDTIEDDTIKDARGYLAHIGIRKAGKSFSKSMDRPAVFYNNSKKIIASIKPMKDIKSAVEENLVSFDMAAMSPEAPAPESLQPDSHDSSADRNETGGSGLEPGSEL